jgi:hypothetical protein
LPCPCPVVSYPVSMCFLCSAKKWKWISFYEGGTGLFIRKRNGLLSVAMSAIGWLHPTFGPPPFNLASTANRHLHIYSCKLSRG